VRLSESSRRRHSSRLQRGQRADAPGASSGRRCRRSQSGHAMSDASRSGWLYTLRASELTRSSSAPELALRRPPSCHCPPEASPSSCGERHVTRGESPGGPQRRLKTDQACDHDREVELAHHRLGVTQASYRGVVGMDVAVPSVVSVAKLKSPIADRRARSEPTIHIAGTWNEPGRHRSSTKKR